MRTSGHWLSIVLLLVLGLATTSFAGSVSAAKSRIVQAQDYADKNQKDDAIDKLNEAEKFLDGLTDDEKAPIVKQIAELRAKLGSSVDPEISARIERNVGRFLSVAEGDADSSPQNAANELDQAVDALNNDDAKKNLNPDARAKLQARVDTLRAKIKGGTSSKEAQRLVNRIEQSLRAATENAGNDTRFARTRLDEAAKMLASDDVKQKLDAPAIQRLQGKLADGETKLAAVNKKDALARATALLNSLDEHLAGDPFKGTDSNSAYKVTEELGALRSRAAYQLTRIPEDDADRKSSEQRLAAAQAKMDQYDAAWGAANVEAAVVNRWKYTAQGFAGWDQESYAPTDRPFVKPVLTKTEEAAQQTKLFLEEKQTVEARGKQASLPRAAGAIAEAEKTRADAQAKLDAAFNQWMDAAEKQPRPQGPNRFDIGAAADMARWAGDRLADSKYKDADVARATKLDQKWQNELAAIQQQHEEALRKMTAEANEAWPKIASSIDAQDGFHPTDAASMIGKTFRFKGVRNRAGWDFDGSYDLVIWVDGQPVAGHYEPKIRRAFSDAARQIGDSVNDHINWDIIAVIEGRGVANRRYTTEVKDEHMNVLGKIEGTEPVTCVVMRVIAVHAGPLAISAK